MKIICLFQTLKQLRRKYICMINKNKIYFVAIFTILISCRKEDNKQVKSKEIIVDATSITLPTQTKDGTIQGEFGGCGYNYTPNTKSVQLRQPRSRELNQINSIVKFTGLSSNFKIYSASIDNAIATIINNERYILYDPKLLAVADFQSDSYWSSMSILAHEIGHHLSGHTISKKGSNPKDELEADKYSGFVLYKLGASLEEATNAIKIFGSDKSSLTHPAKNLRLNAIVNGWNEANETRTNGAIPPPLSDDNDFVDTEFNFKDFYNDDEITDLFSNYSYSTYGFFEGVITDVSKFDALYNCYLGISVTSMPKNYEFKVEKETLIKDVSWNHPKNTSMVNSRNIRYILKPGRKIKIAIYMGGNGGYADITYLKVLKR